MSPMFRQAITPWSNGSGNPSGAFTVDANNGTLVCFSLEGGTTNTPVFTGNGAASIQSITAWTGF